MGHRRGRGAGLAALPGDDLGGVLRGALGRERPLPRLHGVGHTVVLSTPLPRRAPGRPPGRPVPPHVLPTRRRPRLRNYWTKRRGAEAMDYSYALMDLTVYGRQESWEDSPPGWPQQCTITRTDGRPPDSPPVPAWPGGRPIAQWPPL